MQEGSTSAMVADSAVTVFFHYPCFDGVVSAVIAIDFAKTRFGFTSYLVRPVNYDASQRWLSLNLPGHSMVVDFLYHPQAWFWADHHKTTFLSDASKADFEARRKDSLLIYDDSRGSCAGLLFERIQDELSDRRRCETMARWADKIDAARYDSVEEAIFGNEPAVIINRSLQDGSSKSQAYCKFLIEQLLIRDIQEVANLKPVADRARKTQRQVERGLKKVRRSIHLGDDDIAVFSATESRDAVVDRYSAFTVFPEARYSVALVRSSTSTKITAMRNPWREFQSVQLGDIFRSYGGGGHERVASVIVRDATAAPSILQSIVEEIKNADTQQTPHATRVFA